MKVKNWKMTHWLLQITNLKWFSYYLIQWHSIKQEVKSKDNYISQIMTMDRYCIKNVFMIDNLRNLQINSYDNMLITLVDYKFSLMYLGKELIQAVKQ